jgi:hypothetical protein
MKAKTGARAQYDPPLALSAHGIRTHGGWQKTFAEVISGSSTKIAAYDYGKYGLLRFMAPGFNNRKIDEFYRWYSDAIRACADLDLRRYDRRPCLIAHSFGTWIICNAMLKYEDIRFDKIILCGSILPSDFNWAKLFARDQVALVRNECGLKDPWPRWASRLVPGTGPSGSTGFDWFESVVGDVYYDEFGHGEFLTRRHIEEHWMPFLRRRPSPLAVLHGRTIQLSGEFSAIFNETNAIDVEAFGKNYEEAYVTDDLALGWIKVNPDIYTFLIDRESGKAAGYINAIPVDDALYRGIRGGRVADNEVPASGVVAYGRDQKIKVYLMSIAVSEKHRQWGQGLWNQGYAQLIGGFLDKLVDYAKHRSIRATHLLATAWTAQGLQMCNSLGMIKVGNDRFGDAVYEVVLDKIPSDKKGLLPALRRLINAYREMES